MGIGGLCTEKAFCFSYTFMKVKLKNAYNQFQAGAILEVEKGFNLNVVSGGTYYWIPEFMLEVVDESGNSPSDGGSLISVTQEMKSLNIEFK